MSAELETGVLRIAVDTNLAAGRRQARGKLHQRPALNVVNGQLTFFLCEWLVAGAVPIEQNAVPAQDGAVIEAEGFLMGDMRCVGYFLLAPFGWAVPGVGLRLEVGTITALVEAVHDAAMMGI